MGNWHYIVIGASLLLLAFTGWQEYRRRNKKYLLLRITACIIAVASLACIALPLTYNRSITPSNEAVILTDGYNQDSVKHFIDDGNNNTPQFTLRAFTQQQANYKTLHVFGYGLSADELAALHNTPVIFHPSNMGTGVTNINWKQILQAGEKLQVQGSFNNTLQTPVKLVLNGLNTFLDSVNVQPNTTQQFELSTVPKEHGKAVYGITALANNKIIEDEPLPVEVTPADSLKVLILSTSPDFENRFLKDWLSQNSCQVVVRTATSKDKYEKEFLNTPSVNIDRITPALLDKFDAVISDAAALSILGKDEQNNIQSKVAGGLGLIITTDITLPASTFYAATFPVYTQQAKQQKTTVLQLIGANALKPIAGEQALYVRSQPGTKALVTDSSSQVVVNSAIYGAGKIIVTTFNDSYNWMLTGNKDSYYAFWSALFSKAVKKKDGGESITSSPTVPRVNTLLHATFTNIGSQAPQPLIAGSHVYLQQHAMLPYEWQGSYWPVQAGWQPVSTGSTTGNLYVYGANDWKYITANENFDATRQYVLQHNNLPAGTSGLTATETVPLPKIYFFILFVMCCTFLWVEQKFNG